MRNRALFTSDWAHWTTPGVLLDAVRKLDPIGGIGLDPCSNPASATKARVQFIPGGDDPARDVDGLLASWAGHDLVYVNPPFGRVIARWLKKCAREARAGVEIVGCVPARTDTDWFQRYVFGAATALCFWRGRLHFDNPPPTRCRECGHLASLHTREGFKPDFCPACVEPHRAGLLNAVNPAHELVTSEPAGATFPTAIPYWGTHVDTFAASFKPHGRVVRLRRPVERQVELALVAPPLDDDAPAPEPEQLELFRALG